MLRQRIITALIIAPAALACVFLLPPVEFSVFVGIVLTIAAWEWANLANVAGAGRVVYAVFLGVLLAAVWFMPTFPVLMISAAWWLVALVLVVRYPGLDELWGKPAVILSIGVLVLVPGFSALSELKRFEESNYLICLLFFLIWGADIGAYFSGKAFGRAKLAPRVSPGKSWAGFVGGVVTSLLIATLMATYFGRPSLLTTTGVAFLAVCALIAMVSVLGDLTISMFKRHRNIKDSSNLLPGHGGFLDRIDSLLSASPLFGFYLMQAGWLQ